MAKLIVAIDFPKASYEDLKREVVDEPDYSDESGWFTKADGKKVVIDHVYLKRSREDNSFYVFEVIDVRP